MEVRDRFGHLLVFCVQMKDDSSVIVFRLGDKDFEWSAKAHSVELEAPPSGGIISSSEPGLILG